jgi:hypothetical protein
VQENYADPQSAQVLSVPVQYAAAQAAGHLNVVIVGWNDTVAQVSSVTDSVGNAYQLAVGPTLLNGVLSQSIYYAKNILPAAGANTVTVTFSRSAQYPDVRVLEYAGIDSAIPLDVVAAAAGNGTTSSCGAVTTTNATDLLIGANTVTTWTSGAGVNFARRLVTSPDGDIAEDRIVTAVGSYNATAPLATPGAWVMQMVAFRAAPPDTTPPTASIVAPTAGATLTGTASVTVSAADQGSGVAGVQLQVDGVPVGVVASISPYTFSLNTANFGNGTHTLTASAVDFANNIGNAGSVSVTFSNSNPGNPIQSGVWSGTVPLPIVSVHSALLPNGKILMSDGQSLGATAIVWDPATNTTDWVTVPVNIFCNAMEQMANGRILVVGGHDAAHVGLSAANIFDPSTESWTVLPNMAYPRWYPTVTMLPDGRFMVTSGETNCAECDEKIPEIYNPTTNSWSQLSNAPFFFPYYPHVFLLPDGRVLVPADAEAPIVSEVLDLNAPVWTAVGGTAVDGGSTAMYLPAKFLKVGTSVDPDQATRPSVATAYVLDMTQTYPSWRQVTSMFLPRTYHNTTLLPDGTVLVTGGGTTTGATDITHAVLPAELWSPGTETWTILASMSAPRLYHSEALLLPDGRVIAYGGGRFNGVNEPTDQLSAEFFAPPYLFKGPRPIITSAPAQLAYGQNFSVQTPDAWRIAKVSLIRFGSVTHAINMSQRFLPLSFVAGSGSLTVTAPVNANLAPPGNYMLFVVDTNGVPSVAAVVHF